MINRILYFLHLKKRPKPASFWERVDADLFMRETTLMKEVGLINQLYAKHFEVPMSPAKTRQSSYDNSRILGNRFDSYLVDDIVGQNIQMNKLAAEYHERIGLSSAFSEYSRRFDRAHIIKQYLSGYKTWTDPETGKITMRMGSIPADPLYRLKKRYRKRSIG